MKRSLMATNGLDKVVWHLRRAVLLNDGAGLSDGQLLDMFIEKGDGVAFEVLMSPARSDGF